MINQTMLSFHGELEISFRAPIKFNKSNSTKTLVSARVRGRWMEEGGQSGRLAGRREGDGGVQEVGREGGSLREGQEG